MKLFISYRREDWSFVELLAEKLGQQIKGDIFIDYRSIDDTDFERSIFRHLRESDIVLVVVTELTFAPDSIRNDSDWVRREIALALELSKPIVLVGVDNHLPPPATELPENIRNITRMHGIAFYPEYFDAGVQSLAKFIIEKFITPPDLQISSILPESQKFTLMLTIKGHSELITSLAISPDGQTLFSGSADQTINYWNLSTGQLFSTIAHSDIVTSIAISPDGQTLVSGSADKTIRIWNIQTRELLHTLKEHSSPVTSVAISPEGETLVSASADGIIKVWNLHTGQLLHNLPKTVLRRAFRAKRKPLRIIPSMVIRRDGQILINGRSDNSMEVWNLHSGRLLHTLRHSQYQLPLKISVDFNHSPTTDEGKLSTSVMLNIPIEETLRSYWLWHPIYSKKVYLAINPHGQILVSAGEDGRIQLWNLHKGTLLGTLLNQSKNVSAITSIAISPDGQTLVSGSADSTIKVWNLDTEHLLAILTGYSRSVKDLGYLLTILTGHLGPVSNLAFGLGGQCIASASDQTIKIWMKQ